MCEDTDAADSLCQATGRRRRSAACRAGADDHREAFRVSDTSPFPWSRQTVEGERTDFNLTPIDNALEARFAQFLDRASDVAAWAKLTTTSRFALSTSRRQARCATTTPTSFCA
jgi:hypothetical protein